MRYFGVSAVAAGLVMLGACGGGEKKAADSAATDTSAAAAPATNAAPATTPAAGAATAAPITGKTWEVKMIGDEKGYRFEPNALTIKAGDGIKFISVSGGPHNVAFDAATLPPDVAGQLGANMPGASDLSSPMLTTPNQEYTVSFGNVKPGTYTVHCTPHLAMNMKATITVQ